MEILFKCKAKLVEKAVWWPVYQWQSYLWENDQNYSILAWMTYNQKWRFMMNVKITIQMTNSFSVIEWTDQESLATIIAEN